MRKIENPYLFLKINEEMIKKNGGFVGEHGEFVRERMNSHNMRGKTKKSFENCPEKDP